MNNKQHRYQIKLIWTGNTGSGTQTYRSYERSHELHAIGKPIIHGSSDPAFRGDAARWNPEELLVASLSACHKLWFLHLCADAGIVVTAYEDDAEGVMREEASGAGQFVSVALRPHVSVAAAADAERANALHEQAHRMCFIARSMNFPVTTEPATITVSGPN